MPKFIDLVALFIGEPSVYTQGEYGYTDLFIGLPAILGCKGVEKIIELNLDYDEKAKLEHSMNAVKDVVALLGYL